MLSCSAGYYISQKYTVDIYIVHIVDEAKDENLTHLPLLYTSEFKTCN